VYGNRQFASRPKGEMERAGDVLALAGLVPAAGDGEPAAEVAARRRGRRLRLCVRSRAAVKRRRRTAADAALLAQVQDFNRSGRARTEDHVMVPPGVARGRLRGTGRWKAWTTGAVLAAAFRPPNQSARSAAAVAEGGSHGHVLACRSVVAGCIAEQQMRGLRRLRTETGAAGRPLKFLIRNCMWDETQLSLLVDGRRSDQSVMAQHMQITWRSGDGGEGGGAGGTVQDADLVRAPSVLSEQTAAAMWAGLQRGGDPLGLGLGLAVLPGAELHGLLSTCDGAASNRLLVKHMATQPGGGSDRILQLSCFCVQHAMGSVVECVTKQLGILSPTFSLALTMRRGSFVRDLREEVRRILDERLLVLPEYVGSASDGAFGRVLLSECFVEEGHLSAGSQARRVLADRFVEFFPGRWEGWGVVCKAEVIRGRQERRLLRLGTCVCRAGWGSRWLHEGGEGLGETWGFALSGGAHGCSACVGRSASSPLPSGVLRGQGRSCGERHRAGLCCSWAADFDTCGEPMDEVGTGLFACAAHEGLV
jgi:hypothetical protein